MRNVVVTGHTKGIGWAIANMLLKNGHSVHGIARTSATEHPNLTNHQCDLSDLDATTQIGTMLSKEKNIDAIICNAGAGNFGALENFSGSQIQQAIQLNLISPLVLVRTLLPTLKNADRSNIIFIGSESALQGGRYGSVYSAAKFGLRGAAQSLRHECASANCHVGIVQPGMTRTEFFNEQTFEPGPSDMHALLATDVAEAVNNMLCASTSAVIDEIVINPVQRVVQKKK